ncbi:EVE domain-containing protein [Acidovorax sp. sic0104]|uniref:EVE domain-containing protein n=1 Tax=Acidovorax sp. sic0104 TaxID=2854784 RepID=UPI001C4879C8|nr:EVE domain-containing protein [Acidovorax sp. sic0104]MBV7544284.1 EVE domain-containing protein [Acidovorax sp. sic0104]
MQHALWADTSATSAAARSAPRTLPSPAAAQSPRNWIAVACADHARRACATPGAGFMQVCHGKAAPLRRLRVGDRVAYYAPHTTMGGNDRLQAFISIGHVLPGDACAFDAGGGFVPYRRSVDYVAAREAPIRPLLHTLEFVLADPAHWGSRLRFGLFSVSDHDMRLIAQAMGADTELLCFW